MNRFSYNVLIANSTTINRGAKKRSPSHRESFQRFTSHEPIIDEIDPDSSRDWRSMEFIPPLSGGQATTISSPASGGMAPKALI
jgi:hypothetical protein